MAADSQDRDAFEESASSARSFNASPDSKKQKHASSQSQTGKLWDAFGNPEDPANALAKSTYKPQGKPPKDATYSEIIGEVSVAEFSKVHKRPCGREALMSGIVAGFGIGGLRAVLKGRYGLWNAGNWAVGTFAIVGLGSYEYCRFLRNRELSGMAEALDLMNKLKAKRQKEKDAADAEAARLVEEGRKKSWTNLTNYKFW